MAEPQPPTVAEVVKRAVEVCDPTAEHPDLSDLLARFDDSDEPVTAVADLDERLAEAVGRIDADATDPALVMASATAVYLAHRRDEMGHQPIRILELAARAEFDRRPPERIADWLRDQGADV